MSIGTPRARAERNAWVAVAAWTAVVLATIPLASAIQARVEARFGSVLFLWSVLAVVAAATVAMGRALARRRPRPSLAAWAWLLGVAAVFASYTWALRGNPEEAVHFVEYGVLGALLHRALAHRVQDPTIYPAAALLAAVVGVVDEAVQWLTPGRYWSLGDVWLNFTGAALTLVAIGGGLRPPGTAGPVGAASVRRLLAIAIGLVAAIAASVVNTPPRIAWYTAVLPGLDFVRYASGAMLEYGHRYDDPEIGVFRSRFGPAELRAVDAARAAEAGAILRAFAGDGRYGDFLARYTPITDPFVHEARVHLFRRDRILSRADLHPEDPAWYPWHVTNAFREQLILERWFSRTLAAAAADLPAETRARLARDQDPAFRFESRVSQDVVTAVDERQVVAGLAGVLAALLVARWWAGRGR